MNALRPWLGCLVALLLSQAARAFERTLVQGPATLTVRALSDAQGVPVSEVIAVTETLEGGMTLAIEAASPRADIPNWLLVEARPATWQRQKGGSRWQRITLLAPLVPGVQSWQAPPLRWRDRPGDAWQEITWPALDIPVALAKTDAKAELRDITAIETLPAVADAAGLPWPWIGVAGCAIAVLGWLLRPRRRQRSALDPARTALQHLERLVPREGREAACCRLLALIVRRYLASRYRLARGLTTTDLVHALRELGPEANAERQFLEPFLRRCDQIKFARAKAAVCECQALVNDLHRYLADQHQQTA